MRLYCLRVWLVLAPVTAFAVEPGPTAPPPADVSNAAAVSPPTAPAEVAALPPPPAPAPAVPAYQVTAYGLLVTNFYVNSLPVQNQDSPFAAVLGGASAFGASARQSRFGVTASSKSVAEVLHANTVDAQLEIDFFGGYYPANNQTFYAPLPRLRLFFGSVSFAP